MTIQEMMALVTALEKAKTLKMNYVDEEDIEIIKYVSKVLDTFSMEPETVKDKMTLSKAKSEALKMLNMFGGKISTRADFLLMKTPLLEVHPLPFIYSGNIKYELDSEGNVLKNSGHFIDIKVPRILDTSAPVFLGHECVHLLKENNYNEYVDAYVYGDIIPLFFELVKMNEVKSPRAVLAERMHCLLCEKINFDYITKDIEVCGLNNELNKYNQSRTGEYLNSFYYALILFNLYKENPKKILKFTKMVLNHEITTRQMLMALGIYKNMDNSQIFEKELNIVKSI